LSVITFANKIKHGQDVHRAYLEVALGFQKRLQACVIADVVTSDI